MPSIVLFRLRNMRPEIVNRYMQTIIEQHRELLEEKGAVASVTEGQIRVRPLPLRTGG